MRLTRDGADIDQHPRFPGHDIQLGCTAGRSLDDRRSETGPPQVFVPARIFYGFQFQLMQAVYQICNCRGGVQARKRHGAMAHAAGNNKLCPQSTLLGGADQTILRFTDNCPGNCVGVAPVNKIPDPQHLVFFVAQDTPDDSSGKLDAGSFQRRHGNQHGRQVPLGVVRSATVHALPHYFSAKGIIAPR